MNFISLLVGAYTTVTAAAAASSGTANVPRVMQADLVERINPVIENSHLVLANIFDKQQPGLKPFVESVANKWTYYCANITVGTPGQSFLVQLDTGSSDLWIPGKVIKPDGFSPSQSSSFKYLSQDFYVRYIKDFARGYWGADTVSFPASGVILNNQHFGVATHIPESTIGILGIGPGASNNSIPQQLVAQGICSRNAYSIYLGERESKHGKILFGGVDESKFHNISAVPMKSNSSFTIDLDRLSIGNYSSGRLECVLDTGTSLVYLPDNIVSAVASRFGAIFNPSLGMYILAAQDHASMPDGLEFQFGGAKIQMSRDDLFWPLSYFTLDVSPYRVLTIVSNSQSMGINVLGSSFLRSAYVLFEPDRSRVQIGQYVDGNYTRIVAV